MSSTEEKIAVNATLLGVGAGLGVGTAATGHQCVQLHRAGLAGPANQASYAFTNSLKHHATVGQAAGAALTALLGAHTVAVATAATAAAAAAAPFVLAGGAAALAGYGLFRACKAVSEEAQQPKEGLS